MSLIYYEGCENRIVSPSIRNCSAEEASIKQKIAQIIRDVALKNQRRSSSVNTEEYMQLPLADDEQEPALVPVLVPVPEPVLEPALVPVPAQVLEPEQDEIISESSTALSDEEKCHEIIGKPVLELSDDAAQSLGDCAICLENVSQLVNATTTRCGHTFHTSCLLKAITCGAGNCPNCRALLVIKDDEDESEYESEYDSDDGSDDGSDDEEEQQYVVTLEQASETLQAMGYTFADILRTEISIERFPNTNQERYTEGFLRKMWDDIFGVLYGNLPQAQAAGQAQAAQGEVQAEAEPFITQEEAEELLEVLEDVEEEAVVEAEAVDPLTSQEYLDENYPWMKAQGARKNE